MFNKISPELEEVIRTTINSPKYGLNRSEELKAYKKAQREAYQAKAEIEILSKPKADYTSACLVDPYKAREIAQEWMDQKKIDLAETLIEQTEAEFKTLLEKDSKKAIAFGATYLPEGLFSIARNHHVDISKIVSAISTKVKDHKYGKFRKNRLEKILTDLVSDETYETAIETEKFDARFLIARYKAAKLLGLDKKTLTIMKSEAEYETMLTDFRTKLITSPYDALELAKQNLGKRETKLAKNKVAKVEHEYKKALMNKDLSKAVDVCSKYLPDSMFELAITKDRDLCELITQVVHKTRGSGQIKRDRIKRLLTDFASDTNLQLYEIKGQVNENYFNARIKVSEILGLGKSKLSLENYRLRQFQEESQAEISRVQQELKLEAEVAENEAWKHVETLDDLNDLDVDETIDADWDELANWDDCSINLKPKEGLLKRIANKISSPKIALQFK